MMSVTKAPEVWAAGVAIVPFVNWFTEIENEDPELRQSDLATMGDPAKNKALYEERSPINFIDQIKAPLLLLAGGHDPRCPKSETQQVVDAIKKTRRHGRLQGLRKRRARLRAGGKPDRRLQASRGLPAGARRSGGLQLHSE